jgi:hypothetical protein
VAGECDVRDHGAYLSFSAWTSRKQEARTISSSNDFCEYIWFTMIGSGGQNGRVQYHEVEPLRMMESYGIWGRRGVCPLLRAVILRKGGVVGSYAHKQVIVYIMVLPQCRSIDKLRVSCSRNRRWCKAPQLRRQAAFLLSLITPGFSSYHYHPAESEGSKCQIPFGTATSSNDMCSTF